ncbi:uncharacterized protein LOC144862157 [Branchiostoma floridae x Branchiostoma japonicum]
MATRTGEGKVAKTTGSRGIGTLMQRRRREHVMGDKMSQNDKGGRLQLYTYGQLPRWYQQMESPYITAGYRNNLSYRQCLRSVFQIHNETGNIWTHLLAAIFFLPLAWYDVTVSVPGLHGNRIDYVAIVTLHLCFQIVLWLSVYCHTFLALGCQHKYYQCLALDLWGIGMGSSGILLVYVACVYCCSSWWQVFYYSLFGGLITWYSVIWLHPKMVPDWVSVRRRVLALFPLYVVLYGILLLHPLYLNRHWPDNLPQVDYWSKHRISHINMASLADRFQDLELCLKSHNSQEHGYGRALREAILCMDIYMEVEVLKSLGDLNLQKGKRSKDASEIDKAAALYAAALLRCKDTDMGQTLEHRIGYMEKLSRRLLQGYTPRNQSPDYWRTTDNKVLRAAKICDVLDIYSIIVSMHWHSIEEKYTEILVTAISCGDVILELEVLKSSGDFYLEKGKKTRDVSQFSKAAAMYGKALRRCEDPETKQTLQHRVLYMVKIWGAVRRQPSPNKSRPRERKSSKGSAAAHKHTDRYVESSYQEHLQEGCRALHTGDLDRAEQHFAAALKSVHVRDSKADQYTIEAEPLYKLSYIYLTRGIQSKDGGDFTKAAALCNAALTTGSMTQ